MAMSCQEDRLERIEGAEATLWEWKTAHLQPPARTEESGSGWGNKVHSYKRHYSHDQNLGTQVHFNVIEGRFLSKGRVQRGPTGDKTIVPEPVQLGPGPSASRDNEPWLAYYPEKVLNWRGSLFHRVVISNKALPFVIEGPGADGKYRLRGSLSKSWKELEDLVVLVCTALLPRVKLPYSVNAPTPPSHHKYQGTFDTLGEAIMAVRKARSAFHYLGAFLAFLAAFWCKPGSTRAMHLLARWLSLYLRLEYEQAATLLCFAPVNPNAGLASIRRGLTMTVTSPYLRYLPIFLDSHLPVVVELGGDFREFMPEMREESSWPLIGPLMTNAVKYVAEDTCCEWCTRECGALAEEAMRSEDPMKFAEGREAEWVNHCLASGQCTDKIVAGTNIHDFWGSATRRELRRFSLYEWLGEPNDYRRCPIQSNNFDCLTQVYPLKSRYVSLLHNEIDFFNGIASAGQCAPIPGVAPTPAPAPTPGSSPIPDPAPVPPLIPALQTHAEASLPQDVASVECEEGEILEPLPAPPAPVNYSDENERDKSSSSPSVPHISGSWRSILRTRLGYNGDDIPPPVASVSADHPVFPRKGDKGINRALRFLGLVVATSVQGMSSVERLACLYAAQTLHDPSLTLYSLPVQFDMAAGNVLAALGDWAVERLTHEYYEVNVHTKALVHIVEHRYAIGIRSEPMAAQYYLVVVDAPTLLEVARLRCRGIVDIARQLSLRGIAFATARYFPASTRPNPPYVRREGLGIIQDRNNFSSRSYSSYERQRDDSFVGALGGLALKEGGVVARLARGVLPNVNAALKPPSARASRTGRVLGCNHQGLIAISDRVSFRDLDTILGRYLHFKGKGEGKEDQEAATLWPSATAWDASFLNTGAWNDEAEAWFLRQVERWRTPVDSRNAEWKLRLKTSREWRSSLRATSGLRETWRRYSKLANDCVLRHTNLASH